jgi:hypothetical protein
MNNPWDEIIETPTARTPRSFENREQSSRRRSWVEPTMLPDPLPQDGYVFKWVRTATRNTEDKTNYQKRIREGWEPVDAADHPELMLELSVGQTSGKVEVGGLILCKMPEEMAEQRKDYYQRRTAAEMDSAENTYLRDSDERMKKFRENQRKTVFGR